jgi:hypothetical protein
LLSSLSPRPVFNAGPSSVGFVMDKVALGQVSSKHDMSNLWHSDGSVVLRTDEAWRVVIEVINTDRDLCGDSIRWNA